MTENYDVLYLEDDPDFREYPERWMGRKNISFNSCGSLEELSDKLIDTNYKIFLLDGSFPKVNGGEPEINFPDAVKLIKEKYESPKIILYSGEREGQSIADRFDAKFYSKGDYDPEKIVEKLEQMLQN